MATEAVRDIPEVVNFTARGREAHKGSKINPKGKRNITTERYL